MLLRCYHSQYDFPGIFSPQAKGIFSKCDLYSSRFYSLFPNYCSIYKRWAIIPCRNHPQFPFSRLPWSGFVYFKSPATKNCISFRNTSYELAKTTFVYNIYYANVYGPCICLCNMSLFVCSDLWCHNFLSFLTWQLYESIICLDVWQLSACFAYLKKKKNKLFP